MREVAGYQVETESFDSFRWFGAVYTYKASLEMLKCVSWKAGVVYPFSVELSSFLKNQYAQLYPLPAFL